jgi:hypothetical protein
MCPEDFSATCRTCFRSWFLGLQRLSFVSWRTGFVLWFMCQQRLSFHQWFLIVQLSMCREDSAWAVEVVSGEYFWVCSDSVFVNDFWYCRREDFGVSRINGFWRWFLGLRWLSFRQWFLILELCMCAEDFSVGRRTRFQWWFLRLHLLSFREWFVSLRLSMCPHDFSVSRKTSSYYDF